MQDVIGQQPKNADQNRFSLVLGFRFGFGSVLGMVPVTPAFSFAKAVPPCPEWCFSIQDDNCNITSNSVKISFRRWSA